MILPEDRQNIARAVEEARRDGARLAQACDVAVIDGRTLQTLASWQRSARRDARPDAMHPTPAHALGEEERKQILQIANEAPFAELLPARIVPMLADQGVYIAGESSFSRVFGPMGKRVIEGALRRHSVDVRRPLM